MICSLVGLEAILDELGATMIEIPATGELMAEMTTVDDPEVGTAAGFRAVAEVSGMSELAGSEDWGRGVMEVVFSRAGLDIVAVRIGAELCSLNLAEVDCITTGDDGGLTEADDVSG